MEQPVAALLLALTGIAIALTYVEVFRGLRRRNAGPVDVGLPTALVLAWALAVFGWANGALSAIFVLVASVVWILFVLGGHRLIRRTTRPAPERVALYRAFDEIAADVRRPGLTFEEVQLVLKKSQALNGFRAPDTSAWIDLVQEELRDWANGSGDPAVVAARRQRILDLGDGLFLGRAGGSPSDIRAR